MKNKRIVITSISLDNPMHDIVLTCVRRGDNGQGFSIQSRACRVYINAGSNDGSPVYYAQDERGRSGKGISPRNAFEALITTSEGVVPLDEA